MPKNPYSVFPSIDPFFPVSSPKRLDHKSLRTIRNYNLEPSSRAAKAIVGTSTNAGLGDFKDIQAAIDYVDDLGGGVVFLKAGTYTLTTGITLYNNITLVGEDPDTTIIDANSTNSGISANGSAGEYAVGTITVTNGSTTVTGSGTSWAANVDTTKKIVIDGVLYDIASVDSDTQITLSKAYQGVTISSLSYYTAAFLRKIVLKDFTLQNAAGNMDGQINLNYIYDSWVENVRSNNFISGTYGRGFHLKRCVNLTVLNCLGFNNIGINIYLDSGQSCVIDNCRALNSTALSGIYLNNSLGLGTKNIVRDCISAHNEQAGIAVFSGKNIIANNIIYRNNLRGIDVSREETVIIGNIIEQNADYGVWIHTSNGDNCTVSGNYISFNVNDGIRLSDASDYNTIVGNNVRGTAMNQKTINNLSTGVGNFISGNWGADVNDDVVLRKMKNTSGGTIGAGALVVLSAVAAGDEVTTTTTQGNQKAFGVATESIADTAYGLIQTSGKTTLLKVNGTTAIVVGDFIGSFTTAEIGMKAATGNTAIAIALEAYATADSLGVIDALIISPRAV